MKQYSLEDRHLLFFILDFFIVIFSSIISYYIVHNSLYIGFNYKVVILINTLIVLLSTSINHLYCSWRGLIFIKQIYKVFTIWFFSFICLLALLFFSKQLAIFSITWVQLWFVIGVSLTCLYRVIVSFTLNKCRQQGKNSREIMLVGNGIMIDNIIKTSQQHLEYGFNINKTINLSKTNCTNEEVTHELFAELDTKKYHELWICLPLSDAYIIKGILHDLRHSTVDIRFFPDLEGIPLLNYNITNLMGFSSLNLSSSSLTKRNRAIKRYEDVILSVIILIIITVPCLLIMVLIKLTSPGPILFKQKRHGVDKQIFEVYKFRSMTMHKETSDLIVQATKNDVRITKLGAFLRKTSLDELPQFVNVLQGKMSVVGPRPHALSHNEYYKDLVDSYMWRHKVKPGITGWAQINGYRGETDTLYKMQKRVEYDLWYIENWSLYLDLKIVFFTIFKGFINKNAY
ncbi:MAG: undecaprenyl-phosphate glucose phosphotransferase [Methylococcales bacterium]|nr:undecaprenyl-phosphate glucose phosphotransferase [Methylococcales bacterium]